MTELKLYNTLTRRKDALVPLATNPANGKPMVRMYVCGPTVYDYAHIGNARPVIVFDVLFRLLRHLYGEENVIYARNITDVDDKINARAARDFPGLPLNEAIRKVTEGTNAQYQKDTLALGNLSPTSQPRATDHLDEMRAITEKLIAKGFAYVAEDHVLFSPSAMNAHNGALPRYGAFSKRSLDELLAGARIDVATYKRDAMDFVLWKPSDPGQPGWPSPAGIKTPGRPGWHIECSAMAMKQLLEPYGGGLACDDPLKNTFDIHGGGIDLVFPHHENEIAQSCCAFGAERMANIWMHNGFLQVEGEKMSKSLGNFVTISELLETEKFGGRSWDGQVLRLAMLRTHYTQPIDWTEEASKEAEMHLDNWATMIADVAATEPPDGFLEALYDDLNTPAAIASLHKAARSGQAGALRAGLEILGFNLQKDGPYRSGMRRALERTLEKVSEQEVQALVDARIAARATKNWAESDRIRDELLAMGIQIMDSKDPVTGALKTTWEVKR
ncbi:MAG: cysteine--tRNA ligase [Proteobacteria bacterium]|nr:cysteine--tRNA ligase [Pseudomonadota bacterium]